MKDEKILTIKDKDLGDVAGGSGGETEFSLQEQQEDGKHRVVAEAFAGVGQSQGEQALRLVFEHICAIN